ncbi:uncharacterized protein LOC124635947 [Helicoverpa zea]|uniref:uncharacterized protein LOC124635947 n=1 Tax=Helicoverpa zea TaxID=7113 RepID=UPI001F59ADF3|nr:uncharacterized protein LOC124635947 [Helicoverpa zea]
METQRKKRGENWTTEEKDILRQLVAESAKILEDKSTKTNVNVTKSREWKNVTNKLNELTGKTRTDAELKLAWKRMKLAAKANLSLHRREQSQTGGGNKPPSPSPEDLAVMAIAPHDFIIEVNDYDSDAMVCKYINTSCFMQFHRHPRDTSSLAQIKHNQISVLSA